jgi:murein L,D-transpeptidase YcbB/YkuD
MTISLCFHLFHRFSRLLILFVLPVVVSAGSKAAPTSVSEHSPSDQGALRSLIDAGNLADLRWPNFTDYRNYVKSFYEASNYSPAWLRDGRPSIQASAAIKALEQADEVGLNAEDYDGPRWKDRVARLGGEAHPASQDEQALFDLALTVSLMRYVSDLHIGRVNPQHLKFGFDVERRKYDLPKFLRDRIVNSNDVGATLAEVEPPFDGYRRTQEALRRYLQLASRDNGEKLPTASKTLESGDSYPGTPQLARFLKLIGDLPENAALSSDPTRYEGPVVEAVKHFQQRHGLSPDGRIGKQTLEELNRPLSYRVRQLQLTLERWRWLPHGFERPPVVVNIPEFRLRAFGKGGVTDVTMNVVVGRAYRTQTPVFEEEMSYLVFRPYWNVPMSIQRGELVPKVQKDPEYLGKNRYEVVDRRGDVVTAGTVSKEQLAQLRSGTLSIRQKPGPKNALGLVKFIFPNQHNVYLHSTPSQELFSRTRRDFSHGCIRVEDPVALAEWALQANGGWTKDKITAAMNSGTDSLQVNLTQKIPVLILYGTAVVPPGGQVYFFEDIYRHDAALEKALAKGYPYPW